MTSVSPRAERSEAEIETVVSAVHASQTKMALAVTGGGSGVIPRLLARPGASRTVLDAQVPYGPDALAELLGAAPDSHCSKETARLMAASAYERAQRLREFPTTPVLGLGATAALTTDRERRGPNVIYVAVVDGCSTWEASLQFRKGARTRAGEEAVAERAIVTVLAEAMGISDSIDLARGSDEPWSVNRHDLAHPRDVLERGEQPWATVDRASVARAGGVVPGAVVSGAFNPYHAGHAALLDAARRRTEAHVSYEISIINVDKPPLSAAELDARLAQFHDLAPVVLTCAPTFVEKARLLPGCAFVVGADTASRILEPRYYGGGDNFELALIELRELGATFHVAGRLIGDSFRHLDNLEVPVTATALFSAIPESEARVDISSSELRGVRDA